jgi:hypothetical protein
MVRLIVEYVFDPPATDALFNHHGEVLEPCLKANGVAWVESFVAADRKRRICVFDAVDAETVRSAFRSADVEFERVWVAEHLRP